MKKFVSQLNESLGLRRFINTVALARWVGGTMIASRFNGFFSMQIGAVKAVKTAEIKRFTAVTQLKQGVNQMLIRRGFFTLAALALLTPMPSFACAACTGRSDSSLAVGMNWGIFTLMAVIGGVLATFAGFFIYIVRRQNAFAKAAEQMAEQNLSEAKV